MNDVSVDDLTELYRAGAVKMPQVAVQYSEMAQELHKTALSETAAFSRSIGGLGPLYSAWTNLRDIAQGQIAVTSHENFIAAGEVLATIATNYANTDNLNAAELNEYQDFVSGISDPGSDLPDYERPPAYIPDAPDPDDPHPEEQTSTGPGF